MKTPKRRFLSFIFACLMNKRQINKQANKYTQVFSAYEDLISFLYLGVVKPNPVFISCTHKNVTEKQKNSLPEN